MEKAMKPSATVETQPISLINPETRPSLMLS